MRSRYVEGQAVRSPRLSGGAVGRSGGPQQRFDVGVCRLREVLVPLAHGVKRLRHGGTDHVVGLEPEGVAGRAGPGGHRHDDARGVMLPHAAVRRLATGEFALLAGGDALDGGVADLQMIDEGAVADADAAGRDGAGASTVPASARSRDTRAIA